MSFLTNENQRELRNSLVSDLFPLMVSVGLPEPSSVQFPCETMAGVLGPQAVAGLSTLFPEKDEYCQAWVLLYVEARCQNPGSHRQAILKKFQSAGPASLSKMVRTYIATVHEEADPEPAPASPYRGYAALLFAGLLAAGVTVAVARKIVGSYAGEGVKEGRKPKGKKKKKMIPVSS